MFKKTSSPVGTNEIEIINKITDHFNPVINPIRIALTTQVVIVWTKQGIDGIAGGKKSPG